jgi:hypothetical protein
MAFSPVLGLTLSVIIDASKTYTFSSMDASSFTIDISRSRKGNDEYSTLKPTFYPTLAAALIILL